MTLAEAGTLVDYHYWARDRMMSAVEAITLEEFTRDLGSSFGSIRDTVVHTYGAERTWYLRWVGQSPPAPPDAREFGDPAAVRGAWRAQEEKVRVFLGSLEEADLTRNFHYRSFAGVEMQSTFAHMLQHVVNHASYHRGQVTTLLRQMGRPGPKQQDLIAFYRERMPS